MAQIFISYRREDGSASAGRISDRLLKTFSQHDIFMDVDSIGAGEDFVRVIEEAVSKCEVLIAVIGHNWLNLVDKKGGRALDNPHDFVRIEIRAALQRDIRVIPVLVENASMPAIEDLPDDLQPLARRNALQVDHAGFNEDIQRLIEAISKIMEPTEWKRAKAQNTVAAYQQYLQAYPNGLYAQEARKILPSPKPATPVYVQHPGTEPRKKRTIGKALLIVAIVGIVGLLLIAYMVDEYGSHSTSTPYRSDPAYTDPPSSQTETQTPSSSYQPQSVVDETKNTTSSQQSDPPSTNYSNEPASYSGHYSNWNEYISREVQYPYEALLYQVQGTVCVQFTVDQDGQVGNARILSGPELLQNEALRLVLNSGRWKPAISGGQYVRSDNQECIQFYFPQQQ